MWFRAFLSRARSLAPLLVACAAFVGTQSLAEVAGGDEAETVTEAVAPTARPPIMGLDAILSRIPDAIRASAGRGSRVADVENSIIHTATDESWEPDRRLRNNILGHEAAILAVIREVAPGATIVPTSFLDGEADVVRHARETGADFVVMAFGEPARVEPKKEEEPPPDDGRLAWLDRDISIDRSETPTSLYMYALALTEQPETLFVNSAGNYGVAMSRTDLPFHVSAIPNGVAAIWVDENERIHPLSGRCGPAWESHMCIAVSGSMELTDGDGAPYREDGAIVHGTSVAAARLAAGLAVLKQWLREADGRDVSPPELLQIACNTARLGPNTHAEVGCGILDLDAASRGHAWAESTRLVTPTLEAPPPLFGDERRFLPDGSIAIEGEGFDTLNQFGEGRVAAGALLIYDKLLFSSYDGYRGLIAKSVEVDEEENWVEFVLRGDARFHDGASITAQDVIWTTETLMASGPEWLVNYLFEDVERAEERGPRAVRFILKSVRPSGMSAVSRIGWMPILPQRFWDGRDFRARIMEPPLGSGRYRIAAIDPEGRSVTYEPVEDYWGRDLKLDGVRPSTERITYRYFPEGVPHDDGNYEGRETEDESQN